MTRGSILFAKTFFEPMDCRVKPGNDDEVTGRHPNGLGKTRHAAADAATCTLSPGRRNGVAGARGSLTLNEVPLCVSTS